MTNFDIDRKALSWVREEIKQALDRARQALESFVDDNSASAELDVISDNLRQVNGTLKMIGLYGAGQLTDEMNNLVAHLREDKVTHKDDAFEVLMRAIVQLPIYLDNLQKGQRDIPIILLPLLNDLRALCGNSLLSEAAFFNPNLDILPRESENRDPSKTDRALAKKLRPIYQLSLIGIFRNADVAENLKRVIKVLVQLERQAGNAREQQVWWVSTGLLEAVYENGLQLSASVKHLLGIIDRRIRQLADSGAEKATSPLSTEVLKNCLYYIAQAKNEGKRVSQLKEQFQLAQLLPSEAELSKAKDGLLGLDGDLIQHVANAIKEDLLQIKETLDVYTRSNTKDSSQFAAILDRLKTVADTLGMIGMGRQREELLKHHASISAAINGKGSLQDTLIMGIASTLLFVESSLSSEMSLGGDSESLLPQAEFNQLVRTTTNEAKNVLHNVKEAVNSFASDSGNGELLAPIGAQLQSVSGAMLILNQQRGSEMFSRLRSAIETTLAGDNPPGQDTFNTLADIITGGEYFIDAVVDDPIGADKALDVMADGLARLLGEAPAMSDAGADDLDAAEAAAEEAIFVGGDGGVTNDDADLNFGLLDDELVTDIGGEPAADYSLDDTLLMDSGEQLPEMAGDSEATRPMAIPAKPAAIQSADIDPEVMEIFLEEAEEETKSIAQSLRSWRSDTNDHDALTTLRRSYHTIKGSGRIVGAMDIGEFAWAIENMLNRVIDETIAADANLFTVLERACDVLPQFIAKLKGNGTVTPDADAISQAAHALSQGKVPDLPGMATAAEAEAAVADTADTLQFDAMELADDLDLNAGDDGLSVDLTLDTDADDVLQDNLVMEVDENIELTTEEEPSSGIDPVLAEIFTNETHGHLDTVDQFVDQSLGGMGVYKVTHDLIRALHTLHGSANMAGINQMVQLTDDLEKYAKQKMEDNASVSEDFLALLHDTTGAVRVLLQNLTQPGADLPDREQLEARAHSLLSEAVEIGAAAAPVPPPAPPPGEVDEELVGIFSEEAEEILSQMESTLQEWTSDQDNAEWPAQLRRNLHTIKGGARMAGLSEIGTLAHDTETILQKFEESVGGDQQACMTLVQNAHDWITEAVEQLRHGVYMSRPAPLLRQIAALTGDSLNPPPLPATTGEEPGAEVTDEEITLEAPLSSLELTDTEDIPFTDGFDLDSGEFALADADAAVGSEEIILDESQIDAADLVLEDAPDLDGGLTLELQPQDISVEEPATAWEEEQETLHLPDATEDEADSAPPARPAADRAQAGEYDSELLDIFLEEAAEILRTTDELIHQWVADPGDVETMKQIQRALHTMKGGARMAKVSPVGNLSHSMETALEAMESGRAVDVQALLHLVQASYDWLTDAIEKITNHAQIANPDQLIAQIESACGLEAPQPPARLRKEKKAADASPKIADKPVELAPIAGTDAASVGSEEANFASILEAAALLEEKTQATRPAATTSAAAAKTSGEVIRVGTEALEGLINNAGEISIYRSRIDLQLGTITHNLVELEHTVNRIREQLRKFEIEAETQILYRFESAGGEASDRLHFDPLELDRFSNMQQLSRSLAESVGDLTSIQKFIAGLTRETEILLVQQSRVTSELQNGLMRTRLVPFSSMVPRLRRIVRQTSQELGKEVEFKIHGAEGEMDRTVLNRFIPALEHMLRNAIDHGIELPTLRKKNRKPPTGTIEMDFSRTGGEFIIRIKDDGAGMNLDAIRKKAVEKGLMEKTADLSNNEIVQFIMEPGFSTATKVTQISGRGVGMDVVNTEIKQLGGNLQIDTDAGKGSLFTVHLPLTVSVNQALIVLVGEQTYAIPLANIVGIVRLNKEETDRLHNGRSTHYEYASHSYQYFHLGTLMNICKPQIIGEKDKIPMILARAGDHRVALLAEAIIGRSEVVVKTVGPQISSVKGISGATIMGDGSVALILDIPNMVRGGLAHIATGKAKAVEEAVIAGNQPTILVVDDSITVRKVTERLLKRHDMIPVTAKDGMDALDKLQDLVPDLILSDIEMPRMDGYEFVANVRRDERLRNVPVIMITSRTGSKHRDRAMDIGADMYMGKPYQDTELLENIGKLIRERK